MRFKRMERKELMKEEGFTLIEIIAVLVILGILAAVAVPKYFNLTRDAENRAVQAVHAEIQSRANLWFAKIIVQYNGNPKGGGYTFGDSFDANLGQSDEDGNGEADDDKEGLAPVKEEFPGWTINNAAGTMTAVPSTPDNRTPWSKAWVIKIDKRMSESRPAVIGLDDPEDD